jgi:hypothetical protein
MLAQTPTNLLAHFYTDPQKQHPLTPDIPIVPIELLAAW